MKYPSDLTHAQFKQVSRHIPKVKSCRPRKYKRVDIFNGILYRVKTGCPWRYLPKSYPNWKMVYYHFSKWKKHVFRYINHKLNLKSNSKPEVLVLDSQSIHSSSELSLPLKGFDSHKKKHGLKNFILTDTKGNVWFSWLIPANTSERTGAEYITTIANHKSFPSSVHTILADKGYESKRLTKLIETDTGINFKAMKSTKRYKETENKLGQETNSKQITIHKYLNKQISSLRWIVERNFSWFNRYKILIRVFERTYSSYQANIYLAQISLTLKRKK